MEERIVTHKTAKLAKEKGFDWNPTQTLLQKWLRAVHGIHVNPSPYIESYDRAVTGYYMGEIINSKGEELYPGDDNFASYEEALEAGLQTALEEI